MGGDAGPGIVITALMRVAQRHPNVNFILAGDEAVLTALLARHPRLKSRVRIRHAPDRVAMEDKPSHVLRREAQKPACWRAIEAVKNKEAEVAVSAGESTGALMAMSMFQLGVTDGISRPAIASIWPTLRGQSVVLDCGAPMFRPPPSNWWISPSWGRLSPTAILGLDKPSVPGLPECGHRGARRRQ